MFQSFKYAFIFSFCFFLIWVFAKSCNDPNDRQAHTTCELVTEGMTLEGLTQISRSNGFQISGPDIIDGTSAYTFVDSRGRTFCFIILEKGRVKGKSYRSYFPFIM